MKKTILLIILTASLTPAAIKYVGRINFGVDYRNYSWISGNKNLTFNDDFSRVLETKMEFRFPLQKGVKGIVDIRGDMNSPALRFKKVMVQYKWSRIFRLQLGNLKKCFGIEETSSRDELLTIRRSRLHEHVSAFGALGYDMGVGLRAKAVAGFPGAEYYMNLSSNGSRQAILNVRLEQNFGREKALGFSILSVYNHERESYSVFGGDYRYRGSRNHFETELLAGEDPDKTYESEIARENKKYYFAGIRLLYARDYEFFKDKSFQPLVQVTGLLPDLENQRENIITFYTGFNINFNTPFRSRFMLNGSVDFENHPVLDEYKRKAFGAALQYQVIW